MKTFIPGQFTLINPAKFAELQKLNLISPMIKPNYVYTQSPEVAAFFAAATAKAQKQWDESPCGKVTAIPYNVCPFG